MLVIVSHARDSYFLHKIGIQVTLDDTLQRICSSNFLIMCVSRARDCFTCTLTRDSYFLRNLGIQISLNDNLQRIFTKHFLISVSPLALAVVSSKNLFYELRDAAYKQERLLFKKYCS